MSTINRRQFVRNSVLGCLSIPLINKESKSLDISNLSGEYNYIFNNCFFYKNFPETILGFNHVNKLGRNLDSECILIDTTNKKIMLWRSKFGHELINLPIKSFEYTMPFESQLVNTFGPWEKIKNIELEQPVVILKFTI